jgi:secreted PhoX family phosphatase
MQGAGVVAQGLELGGSGFSRLEGCYLHGGAVFFTATSGGDFGHGQIWIYRPQEESLTLLFEARGIEALDYPDNLCVSPRGTLLINEDNDSGNPQRMVGMDMDGRTFQFAESNVRLRGEQGFKGDFRFEEWCGVCFSPDGRWLFANCYTPGFTVAITGPWENGPL